jgi:hypothetical protein
MANGAVRPPAVGLDIEFCFHDFGIGPAPIAIGSDTSTLPVKGASGHPAIATAVWTTAANARPLLRQGETQLGRRRQPQEQPRAREHRRRHCVLTKSAVFAEANLLGCNSVIVAASAVPLMLIGTLTGFQLNRRAGERGFALMFWGVMAGYTARLGLGLL